MRPAEIVTVVMGLPLIAALVAAEMADRTPKAAPQQRSAEVNAPLPTFFDEIVVVAKRTTG